jgi:hypothetical protein
MEVPPGRARAIVGRGPQADFWFPVGAETASYTGQWYSENTMQGIPAYRGQITQALPGQTNRVATIGDKQALSDYVKVNEWNDYEIIARGGGMMHIMNGQLMEIFIDDNKDSVNNQRDSRRIVPDTALRLPGE